MNMNCTLQNEKFGVSMNIYKAWARGYTGKNVTICVHDPAGVERTNVELASRFVSFIFVRLLCCCFNSYFLYVSSIGILFACSTIENHKAKSIIFEVYLPLHCYLRLIMIQILIR